MNSHELWSTGNLDHCYFLLGELHYAPNFLQPMKKQTFKTFSEENRKGNMGLPGTDDARPAEIQWD